MMKMHDRLHMAILKSGSTQKQISESVGVSRTLVSFWVNGKQPIPSYAIKRLALCLRVSESWLRVGLTEDEAAFKAGWDAAMDAVRRVAGTECVEMPSQRGLSSSA